MQSLKQANEEEQLALRTEIIASLNQGQRDAFHLMDDFLCGWHVTNNFDDADGAYSQCVVSGYAGTGKTYLLGKLVSLHLGRVLVVAPTHKAKTVLQSKIAPADSSGRQAITVNTVHAVLYTSPHDEIDGLMRSIAEAKASYEQVTEDQRTHQHVPLSVCDLFSTSSASREALLAALSRVIREMTNELSELKQQANTLTFIPREKWPEGWPRNLIIDEASMVNKEMVDIARRLGLRVLAIGDGGQLPPVNAEKGFDLSNPDVELTEIVRQANGSPIPLVAEAIRKAADKTQLRNIVSVAKRNFPETFVSSPMESAMNIVRTNKTRRIINGSEAENGCTFALGQDYIVHKTRSKLNMVVGQHVVPICVISPDEAPNNNMRRSLQNKYLRYVVLLKREPDDHDIVPLIEELDGERLAHIARLFTPAQCEMREERGKEDENDTNEALIDLLAAKGADVMEEDLQDLYELGKLWADGVLFSTIISVTDIINAPESYDQEYADRSGLLLALPYAITAHKAQGSEYQNINVYHDGMFNAGYMSIDEMRKWLYTAVTRAKEKVYLSS